MLENGPSLYGIPMTVEKTALRDFTGLLPVFIRNRENVPVTPISQSPAGRQEGGIESAVTVLSESHKEEEGSVVVTAGPETSR